ncbi:rhomboid family intramembrane serine protease [Aliamphritea hakodatensis]|uniref:rhomboid family intramembrane serine protease n=1 Tax=Aliamphritea hakodatensis TaxID=2895352 RepID=UPI0022FD7034|nr:rhomboid family intramembrane serine protease [Aliamphritea hakodatensis]
MKPVLEVPLDVDLSEFTAMLWKHSVPHRVLEEGDRQILLVAHTVSDEQVEALFEHWQNGGSLQNVRSNQPRQGAVSVAHMKRTPVTLVLILLSVLATFQVDFGTDLQAVSVWSIVDFQVLGDQIRYGTDLWAELGNGELWRLFTPAFMHGSVLHLVFNMLWMWIVARRLELLFGSPALLLMALITGVVSNIAQFWDAGPLFLGMSGVVFGLLGFATVWDRLKPRQPVGLPPAILGFILFMLALGYSGLLATFGFGQVANTAHLAGLLTGVMLALIARGISMLRHP